MEKETEHNFVELPSDLDDEIGFAPIIEGAIETQRGVLNAKKNQYYSESKISFENDNEIDCLLASILCEQHGYVNQNINKLIKKIGFEGINNSIETARNLRNEPPTSEEVSCLEIELLQNQTDFIYNHQIPELEAEIRKIEEMHQIKKFDND